MWLLMVIPSIMISVFLMLGFKREYIPHESMEYTNQMLNSSSSPLSFGQSEMDTAISNFGSLTNHGNQWSVMNISKMSETYLKDITENPTLENIMKTVTSF